MPPKVGKRSRSQSTGQRKRAPSVHTRHQSILNKAEDSFKEKLKENRLVRHDTPHTVSIGERSPYTVDRTRDAENAILQEELGHLPLRNIPLDQFIHATLGVNLGPSVKGKYVNPKTASHPEFRRLLQAYIDAEATGLETKLYKPFETLVNYILKAGGHTNLEYVTIASNALKGSDADRKPDGVLVLRGSAATSPANRKTIRWSQVLVVFEFKHARTSAQDPLDASDEPIDVSNVTTCPPGASFITCLHSLAGDEDLPILNNLEDIASVSSSVSGQGDSQIETPWSSVVSLPLLSGTQSTTVASSSACGEISAVDVENSHPYAPTLSPSKSTSSLKLGASSHHDLPTRKRTRSDPGVREATPREEQDDNSPLYISHLHKRVRQGEPSFDGKHVKLTDREQLASYALEILSAGGYRRSTLGCYIKHTAMEIWHFDRSGGVGSSPLNFKDAPDQLVAVIEGFARATEQQLGFEPFIQGRPTPFPTTALDAIIRFDGERDEKFKILETLSRQRGLTGRGTVVFRVKAFKKKDRRAHLRRGEFAAKLSWQPPLRDGEDVLLKEAADKGVTGLPKVYFSADVDRLSDDVRGKLLPRLPTPLAPDSKDRILRILVMKPICRPLHSVKSADTLLTAFKSLVKCHHELFEKANILHRDVSIFNLMVELDKPQSGCLIDLDLAVRTKGEPIRPPHRSTSRTGCTPFIAIELLSPEPANHRYRHDLESFLYCLWWCALYYEGGERNQNHSLARWHTGSWKNMASDKSGFLLQRGAPDQVPQSNRPLLPCLRVLTEMFFRGHDARQASNRPVNFDWITLGGHVTYEKFMAALYVK